MYNEAGQSSFKVWYIYLYPDRVTGSLYGIYGTGQKNTFEKAAVHPPATPRAHSQMPRTSSDQLVSEITPINAPPAAESTRV